LEEGRHTFGRRCEGGKAGAASNVSTRKPPVTDGVWVSKSADGDFKIEFKPGNRLTLTGTPPGGRPDTANGTFIVDGDRVSLRLPNGMPIILQFVNDVYETTSFGMPMK